MAVEDRHFKAKFGQLIHNDQYTILRKLGEGTTATVWLAQDLLAKDPNDKYKAIKILSHEMSHEPGLIREVDFLKKIVQSADDESEELFGLDNVGYMFDDFFVNSPAASQNDEPTRHLCVVMSLYSTSISALRKSAPGKYLSIHIARNIIMWLLEALQAIHKLGIVHTDVKLDNLLMTEPLHTKHDLLEKYIQEHPPIQDAVSGLLAETQPIPSTWTHETTPHDFELASIYLVDFGHAEWANEKPLADGFSPLSLRAPEVLIGSGFGTAVDIWAVGCLMFELIVGRWLFHPVDGGDDWFIEDDHLAKMQELTGQIFSEEMLQRAEHRNKFFDEDGNLLRIPYLIPVKIEKAIANYKIPGLTEEQIGSAADFIRECLNLDCEKRKSAGELVHHPFFTLVGPC